MPIAPPSQIGLDLMRMPALPDVTSARPGSTPRAQDASAGFSVEVPAGTEGAAAAEPASPESFKRFEAMVLQTFIQNMLPKDGAAVYGKGMAGDMWKSMLAEKIADVMAERGGIGIADHMLGQHYSEKSGAADNHQAAATETSSVTATVNAAHQIAPAIVEGMQRQLSGLLGLDASADEVTIQFPNKRG